MREPRTGWHESIIQARTEIEDKLTPTIRRGLPARLPRLWQQARRNAAAALRLHGEEATAGDLPAECPYRLADLLRHDWFPSTATVCSPDAWHEARSHGIHRLLLTGRPPPTS